MKKENLWKVLKSECSLPEALTSVGVSNKEVSKVMNDIGKSTHLYFSYILLCKNKAYNTLVLMNEINGNEIFSFGEPGVIRNGDIGKTIDNNFVYHDGRWIEMNPANNSQELISIKDCKIGFPLNKCNYERSTAQELFISGNKS